MRLTNRNFLVLLLLHSLPQSNDIFQQTGITNIKNFYILSSTRYMTSNNIFISNFTNAIVRNILPKHVGGSVVQLSYLLTNIQISP